MNQPQPSICVVVLYYNTPELSLRCLQSFFDSDYSNKSLVVVDNNSQKYPVEILSDHYPILHLIRNTSNLGFSAGVNAGIRYALSELNPDYIAVVNSDLFLSSNALTRAVFSFESLSPFISLGAITGKILFDTPDPTIWQAGGYISKWRASGVGYGFKELDHGQFDSPCFTGWASGAFSIFKSSFFSNIGFFNENYFFGQEEWDLSQRILDSGSLIYYDPLVVARHRVGGSYKGQHPVLNTYNGYLNKVIFARTHLKSLFPLWFIIFFARTILVLPFLLKNNTRYISDLKPQFLAFTLSLLTSLFVRRVRPSHLNSVAPIIGTSRSWPVVWRSD